jgi:hypothetical protein
MFDAQTSALAAQIGIGSIRASRVIRDALVANAEVRRGGVSNCTRGRARSLFSVILSKKSAFICEICGSNPAFKIKELSHKIKNPSDTLSTLFEPIRGYFREKNSEFFSGRFHGKSLANPANTPKKTLPKCTKNDANYDQFSSN